MYVEPYPKLFSSKPLAYGKRERTTVTILSDFRNCYDGAALLFRELNGFESKSLGHGSMFNREGGTADPVILKHESKPIVCDGEYLFVTRTAAFGPEEMMFPKPTILEFVVGKDDTLFYRDRDNNWHKCRDADFTVVYRCLV